MRILCDFHHSSLLKSLVVLFEDRLGHEVFRPIGMDWFNEGFWAINNLEDTAKQYLELESQPLDNTPPLNEHKTVLENVDWYVIQDPGGQTKHKACTLDFFKNNQFDILIASIPAHIPIFKELIAKYNPKAKLIIQMGNEWPLDYWHGNVLASVLERPVPDDCNAMFYHQEFDLNVFWWDSPKPTRKVFSFINVLQNMTRGYRDFQILEHHLKDFEFKSFGGQCRDGNMTGERELAEKMREAQFVFHVKDNGDGFGHVIHNAYAMGRPVITRSSDYKNRLAGKLLVEGTFLDLDEQDYNGIAEQVRYLTDTPHELARMGDKAAQVFREVVNYELEAEEIRLWLQKLK